MGKKGFLLLAGLFVLVLAACATTSSTPSVTTSPASKDEQSASAVITATPDDLYKFLIGEWRGWFRYGVIGRLTIYGIDIANGKARCRYTIRMPEYKAVFVDNLFVADFIPGLNPKLTIRWVVASWGPVEDEFVLKDNILEGTRTIQGTWGQPRTVPLLKMEKYVKK